MMLVNLLVLSLLIGPVSAYFVDAGAKDEDTSIITGENWNHMGIGRLNILNTDTPEFFKTHRSGPDFLYTLGDLNPGKSYHIKLGYSEIWGANCFIGARIMRIHINEEVVKDSLDVFEESGCFAALVESFTAEADALGNIKIRFESLKENAMVSFINVVETKTNEDSESSSTPDDSPTESVGEGLEWTEKKEDQNYVARHECSFVQAGTNFYMFGGRESPRRLDIYDYNKDSWTQGSSLPQDLNHFQAVTHEGLIFVIGAFQTNNYPSERASEFIYVYDPAHDIWMKGPQIPVQRRRGGAGVQIHEGRIYIVGGNTVGHSGWCVPWMDEYNPSLGSWTTMPDAPHPRDHFHAAVVGSQLYAASGRCTSRYSLFGDTIPEVDIFDFKRRAWVTSSLPENMPSPRAGASVSVLGNNVVVMGGESSAQSDAYVTVDSLDTATKTWSTLAPMKHARHGTQAIVSGQSIFVAGGSPVRGHGSQRNMEVYSYADDTPVGALSTAGVLSLPYSIEVLKGVVKPVAVQHVSGNQGVFVQSIELSGESADEFVLTFNGTTPLLIGRGSRLEIFVEYIGNEDNVQAQFDLAFSGNDVISTNILGKAAEQIATTTTNPPSFLRNQPTSTAPSKSPYRMPSSSSTASIPSSEEPSSPPTSKPSLRPSRSPSARPSLSSSATTNKPTTAFADIIIDAGANDEDMTKIAAGVTWNFKVFPFVAIANTETPSYFRSHRSAHSFTYVFDGLESDYPYSISLGFAETYKGSCDIGKRVMDIAINGKTIRSNLDVFAEVGCEAAYMETYQVPTNAAGKLEITFSASVENAMVSLLKISSISDPGDSPPKAAPAGSPSPPPSQAFSLSPSSQPSSSSSPFSSLVIDAGSQLEDLSLLSGLTWTYGVPKSTQIQNTDTPVLFRTHRSGPEFTYTLDGLNPAETYLLTLGFAETFQNNCSPGARVMDIIVNELKVTENLDVFAESGCNAAHLEEYSVVANPEGQVVITIEAIVENAFLSFVQLKEASSPKTTSLVVDAGTFGEESIIEGDTWTYGVPSSVEISNTQIDSYFRTHRSGTEFMYTIKDLEPKAMYKLVLGFSEIWKANCQVGKRVMIISINGVVVKDGLDIFREAGCESAHTEIFTAESNDNGSIEISFDASVEHAMVSYIELAAITEPEQSAAPTSSLELSLPSLRPSNQPSFSPSRDETLDEMLIDAGSASEDTTKFSTDTWTFSVPNDIEIKGTETPKLFRSHRSAPSFSYTLEGLLPSIRYHIELGWSEIWWKNCDIGKRTMSISINNEIVNPELDIYKEVGCNKAFTDTFTAKPTTSGEIIISFDSIAENAMVSYIRAMRAG